MTDSTPSASPSKPNPNSPDLETIRNYARPAFYLRYDTIHPENSEPEACWYVESEPTRETIGMIETPKFDPDTGYLAYVVYHDSTPIVGMFSDVCSAAVAIHAVSQHLV